MRILVVDNDARGREVLVQRLRNRQLEAESAQTAAEAVERMSASRYDVVLLEVVMPHSAARDVFTCMQHLPSPPRCIVMSGVAYLWKRANPEVKIAGVLEKPFRFEELLRLIA
ncbi:MAG TPA: response regulator [Thermoanaerobaculia bacterium]|nr:response regulator [Thermoanaerobaculia bacterium]